MKNTYANKPNTLQGFTIVELLIVIVVIAILAVISVAAYVDIKNRAYDSTVQNDLKSLATKLELYRAESGTYVTGGGLISLNFKRSSKDAYRKVSNLIYCSENTRMAYIVTALSTSGNIYYISSENTAPRQYIGEQDVVGLCMGSVSGMAMTWNQRGYAPEDTTGGPWRAWAGGNS